jgi:hypothetical protein
MASKSLFRSDLVAACWGEAFNHQNAACIPAGERTRDDLEPDIMFLKPLLGVTVGNW